MLLCLDFTHTLSPFAGPKWLSQYLSYCMLLSRGSMPVPGPRPQLLAWFLSSNNLLSNWGDKWLNRIIPEMCFGEEKPPQDSFSPRWRKNQLPQQGSLTGIMRGRETCWSCHPLCWKGPSSWWCCLDPSAWAPLLLLTVVSGILTPYWADLFPFGKRWCLLSMDMTTALCKLMIKTQSKNTGKMG